MDTRIDITGYWIDNGEGPFEVVLASQGQPADSIENYKIHKDCETEVFDMLFQYVDGQSGPKYWIAKCREHNVQHLLLESK